jgi:thymidylate synthase
MSSIQLNPITKKFMSNSIDRQYLDLLQDIMDNGVRKDDRTGTGTLSVFGRQIRHKMSEGFPAITTKKLAFKTMVVELLWFLRGSTDIRYLWENNCFIWDGDWYLSYCKQTSSPYSLEEMKDFALNPDKHPIRSKFFSKDIWSLGPVYGHQWRNWSGDNFIHGDFRNGIDQIQNLINDLKTNPDSRRLMVNAWAVHDLSNMVLPPCHYSFQIYTRKLSKDERMDYWFKSRKPNRDVCDEIDSSSEIEQHNYFDSANVPKRAISLMFNMRSTDAGLGLPFNLASYGLLLMMIAKQVNMIPYELVYNGGDVHLYLNHVEPIKEQLRREPFELPIVKLSDRLVGDISEYTLDDIILENYKSHPTIKLPLSN